MKFQIPRYKGYKVGIFRISPIQHVDDRTPFQMIYEHTNFQQKYSINILNLHAYILNAKNLAPPFLSIFFWNKIDDFKNQCSLVFMPVQLTIVVEKIKCV